MQRITLNFNLIDPNIISQSSATEGLHATLDYIPGSNILGAIAGKLYATIKQHDKFNAFDIFHSSSVRFGNATVVINQQVCYPIPKSLHYPKGRDKYENVNNLLHPVQGNTQPKQLREGYVSSKGQVITITKQLHLRTALTPKQVPQVTVNYLATNLFQQEQKCKPI